MSDVEKWEKVMTALACVALDLTREAERDAENAITNAVGVWECTGYEARNAAGAAASNAGVGPDSWGAAWNRGYYGYLHRWASANLEKARSSHA